MTVDSTMADEALSDVKTNLLKEIFGVLDANGSGSISVKEFKMLGEAM